MNHKTITTLLALALLGGCSLDAPTRTAAETREPTTNETAHRKPGAPVTTTAELTATSARVTVRFDADVTDARVALRGVDGLVVTSDASPLEGGAFARGTTQTFDVAFTARQGGHLVVTVSATSQGTPSARVASFAVGAPASARRGQSVVTDGSARVRLMPVQGR